MHFTLVLPPISATGHPTYYFWVLQKWLYEKRSEETTVVMPRQYTEALGDCERWELSEQAQNFNQYHPTDEIPDGTTVIHYDRRHVDTVDRTSPLVRFTSLITDVQPQLEEFYVDTIRAIVARVKTEVIIVTWLNNASLRSAAERTGSKLIFNEFGPLRKPFYMPTAYWDRQGVNGETETTDRWHRESAEFAGWLRKTAPGDSPIADIRDVMVSEEGREEIRGGKERADIGIALQVETDSNAVAYSRGWSNLALVEHAKRVRANDTILLRTHPGGHAIYSGLHDLSSSPLAFLSSVSEVWTVNSSLGIEALFWGRDARIFGESPICHLFCLPYDQRDEFMAWFVLCYLIPYDLLFSREYYAWRLSSPSPSEIAQRHFDHYRSAAPAFRRAPTAPSLDDKVLTIEVPSPMLTIAKLSEVGEQTEYVIKLERDIEHIRSYVDKLERDIAHTKNYVDKLEHDIAHTKSYVDKLEEDVERRGILAVQQSTKIEYLETQLEALRLKVRKIPGLYRLFRREFED